MGVASCTVIVAHTSDIHYDTTSTAATEASIGSVLKLVVLSEDIHLW